LRTSILILVTAASALCLVQPARCLAGEVVVATKQVKLQTKTFLFKLPVGAQRGQR